MPFFLWPQILTGFTTPESHTFNSQLTILFKAIRVPFKNIYFYSHKNMTILSEKKKIEQAVLTRLYYILLGGILYNSIELCHLNVA